ncbi:AMP-binding protein [Pontivivens insulae]|uniref:Acetyl-coenzyme A synthetase n=1 Tax=Pontivivens insulae TaxID=1639689 RepID=A0A2R8ACE1_9RHOB|nr:AMP-binding protein [Pontivivens insulae]RED13810.1 acetyl-CoA synthetase [Pontivivens insulae]SPF29884.1 Acetyl-coenzyme A synthetase [Pontivivens insulae]
MSLADTLVKPLVQRTGTWQERRAAFRWPEPERYNIAEETCERWARVAPDRIALTYLRPDNEVRAYSYIQLSRASSRLANAFAARGVRRGDRVAVLLPQTPETILTHLAAYKLGAIVVPLFTLFGEDGLAYRLGNAGAKVVVTDRANLPKIAAIRDKLPELDFIYSIDEREAGSYGFWQELGKAADACTVAATGPDDPAFISYTSGTTGPPKGALHAHRVLMGHLPGVETHHEGLPQPGDTLWTPADWAWMGGLTNVMLPALAYGVPLLAHRMAKFDPDHAFWLMQQMSVRNVFLPPTALKLMRQSSGWADLRSVGSGGEALGADLLDWGRARLGTTINEFYGQTECNLVLGNMASLDAPRPGSTGRAVPGSDVAIVDAQGQEVPRGDEGEIAVRRGDRAMFLEYWQNPAKTDEKFVGEWMLTGDIARMDEDGFVFFSARTDDVITSSGYRIGPSEIEDCLNGDPDVTMAGVIGVPDAVRTEAVRAYVVLRDGAEAAGKADSLKSRVRERISPHVAPRDIVFVDDLPMTATGKILRRDLRQKAHEDG